MKKNKLLKLLAIKEIALQKDDRITSELRKHYDDLYAKYVSLQNEKLEVVNARFGVQSLQQSFDKSRIEMLTEENVRFKLTVESKRKEISTLSCEIDSLKNTIRIKDREINHLRSDVQELAIKNNELEKENIPTLDRQGSLYKGSPDNSNEPS